MLRCPSCESTSVKLNGHIHNGKQNHRCKNCGRQFVISEATKSLVDKLLLEKISLAGIARCAEVSEVWLQDYLSNLYASCPEDLNAALPDQASMNAYLEDKFDTYVYEILPLKKTLNRLSMKYHHRILKHLKAN